MNRLTILLLACLTMIGPMSIDAYLPTFLAIDRTFTLAPGMVQQTLSIYLVTFATMMLLHGTLSDSFGRRRIVLITLAVHVLASWMAATAQSFGALLAARALQGCAAGGGAVIAQAMVRDRLDGTAAQQALSRIMLVFALAPALAPVLGGWVLQLAGWRAVFVVLAAFSALMFVLTFALLKESLPAAQRHSFRLEAIATNYAVALTYPRFLMLALSTGLSLGGLALYFGSAAHFVIDILGLTETSFAWMFIPLVLGMMVGATLGEKLATTLPPPRLIGTGFAIMMVAAASNVIYVQHFKAAIPWAVLPLGLYTMGMAMVNPALTVQSLDLLPRHRGLASSLQSSLQMLVFATVSGLIVPMLYETAQNLAWGLLACLLLSASAWGISGRLGIQVPALARLQ